MGDARDELLPLLPQLRAYARSLARDPHAADDLAQDTVVLALRAWDRFTPGTNRRAWLFRILHNRFHSVVTRSHVRAEVASEDLEHLASVPAHQEALAGLPEFRRAFARLRPAQREALVLFAVHGMPLEEVAAVCGCEVGTVKSRVNRARNLLKRMLLDDELPVRKENLPVPGVGIRPIEVSEEGIPLAARTGAREPRRALRPAA